MRRGVPDTLRPEARTRTEGGPDVQRRPEYRHVVVPDLPHVLHVREAHKRAHPREVRQLRPHEGGDGPIPDGLGRGQPDLQRPFDLRVRPGRRDGGLALSGLVTLDTLQRLFIRRSRPPRATVFVSQIVFLSDSYPSPEQVAQGANTAIFRVSIPPCGEQKSPGRPLLPVEARPANSGTLRLLPLQETTSISTFGPPTEYLSRRARFYESTRIFGGTNTSKSGGSTSCRGRVLARSSVSAARRIA